MILLVATATSLMMCDGGDGPEPALKAIIDVSAISFIDDLNAVNGQRIKAGQAATFKDASEGGADQWLWEFEGGIGISTLQNPIVQWPTAVGQVKIKLTVTRSSDGKTATDEIELQVGPVNQFNKNIYSFEVDEASGKWDTWSSAAPDDGSWSGESRAKFEIDRTQGANGTSSSAKITRNYTKDGDKTVFLQFSTWKNNAGANAVLKSNTTYIFSYYIKASTSTTIYSADLVNRGGVTGEEQDWQSFGAWQNNVLVATQWAKYEIEFTTSDLSQIVTYENGTANNASPYFQVNPFDDAVGNVTIWIDEVSLKEKEL